MPRGWRLRPGGGPGLLGMVAGVLLVLALVVTGRVLDGPDPRSRSSRRAPPRPRPPTGWGSGPPARNPSGARHRRGRGFPPGHPTPPARDAGAVACYGAAAEAAAAGYAEAPLPVRALNLGGVYLVPVPHGVRRACRRAAERLGFPCPARGCCPSPRWAGARRRRRCAPALRRARVRVPPRGQRVRRPSGYVGAYPEVGRRLVLAAARRPAAAAVSCAGGRPVSRPDVRGHDADLLQCPPGAGPPPRWAASAVAGTRCLRRPQRHRSGHGTPPGAGAGREPGACSTRTLTRPCA